MLLRRTVWEEMNGMDEGFAVAFNDIDLCMRLRRAGYLVVWTPFAELYHCESKSRGKENTQEKLARFHAEVDRFQQRWKKELEAGDPYYNPNLSLERDDFSVLTAVRPQTPRLFDQSLCPHCGSFEGSGECPSGDGQGRALKLNSSGE